MKKFTRIVALVLLALMLLTLVPLSALAVESDRTIVGFEIYKEDELPPLVVNPHYNNLFGGYLTGSGINLLCRIRFRVTYSDGSQQILRLGQDAGNGSVISLGRHSLNGPDSDTNYFTFDLAGFTVTHHTHFVDSPVDRIEILSDPDPLVLGEHASAVKFGEEKGIDIGIWDACYEGLRFTIHYLDGSSVTLDHSDLIWPDFKADNKFYNFPCYDGYNVETQYYYDESFNYWTGNAINAEGVVPMILHYMGKIAYFNVTVAENSATKLITNPVDREVNYGNVAEFEGGITGGDLRYQWQYRIGTSGSWKDLAGENESTLSVTATGEKNGWQFRLTATGSDGKTVYTEPATLTIKYPHKILNGNSGYTYTYGVEDLYVGEDGIYRTPDGYKVYIAVDNAEDGGVIWLGGTLAEFVEAYGDSYFSTTYWDDLKALMDENGYVPLTRVTLEYLRDITATNPEWGETDGSFLPYYLAYDYDRDEVAPPEGWVEKDGAWYYYENGAPKTGWVSDGGTWYYMDANGVMQTGWVSDGGTWYYMDANGVMQTGWVSDGGTWYYMKSSGAMHVGWLDLGGTWYYMKSSGAMATGTVTIGDKQHKFASSGAWIGEVTQSGWVSEGGKWYYYKNGAKVTGWLDLSGTWYYFDSNGVMVTGTVTIGGKQHKFADSGAWIGEVTQSGWVSEGGKWYYYKNSAKVTGWLDLSGTWYYFNGSGVMQTGWVKDGNTWYYMKSSGAMHTGWLDLYGTWYYMNSSGAMVTGTVKIDGKTYKFSSSGVWIP